MTAFQQRGNLARWWTALWVNKSSTPKRMAANEQEWSSIRWRPSPLSTSSNLTTTFSFTSTTWSKLHKTLWMSWAPQTCRGKKMQHMFKHLKHLIESLFLWPSKTGLKTSKNNYGLRNNGRRIETRWQLPCICVRKCWRQEKTPAWCDTRLIYVLLRLWKIEKNGHGFMSLLHPLISFRDGQRCPKLYSCL